MDNIDYKQKSKNELYFIINDCKLAIAANPKNERYADELSDCLWELARREVRDNEKMGKICPALRQNYIKRFT